MVTSEKHIEHPGVIERIENQGVFVKIESRSACGSCNARTQCNISEMQDKIIEIPVSDPSTFEAGQQVTVSLERSLGFQALLLGYMLPFLIVLLSIIVLLAITSNELISALTGLGLLLPYYAWLYSIRKRLKTHFYFKIIR